MHRRRDLNTLLVTSWQS